MGVQENPNVHLQNKMYTNSAYLTWNIHLCFVGLTNMFDYLLLTVLIDRGLQLLCMEYSKCLKTIWTHNQKSEWILCDSPFIEHWSTYQSVLQNISKLVACAGLQLLCKIISMMHGSDRCHIEFFDVCCDPPQPLSGPISGSNLLFNSLRTIASITTLFYIGKEELVNWARLICSWWIWYLFPVGLFKGFITAQLCLWVIQQHCKRNCVVGLLQMSIIITGFEGKKLWE